jgi:hypothetical protein
MKSATLYEDDRSITQKEHRWCVVVGDSNGSGYIERFMFKSDAELFCKTFEGEKDV